MKLLTPIRSEKVWGYEDWIASTHKDGPQKDFIELVKDYPLLAKIIQADDTLSVQVHPDDKPPLNLKAKAPAEKLNAGTFLTAKKVQN